MTENKKTTTGFHVKTNADTINGLLIMLSVSKNPLSYAVLHETLSYLKEKGSGTPDDFVRALRAAEEFINQLDEYVTEIEQQAQDELKKQQEQDNDQ